MGRTCLKAASHQEDGKTACNAGRRGGHDAGFKSKAASFNSCPDHPLCRASDPRAASALRLLESAPLRRAAQVAPTLVKIRAQHDRAVPTRSLLARVMTRMNAICTTRSDGAAFGGPEAPSRFQAEEAWARWDPKNLLRYVALRRLHFLSLDPLPRMALSLGLRLHSTQSLRSATWQSRLVAPRRLFKGRKDGA